MCCLVVIRLGLGQFPSSFGFPCIASSSRIVEDGLEGFGVIWGDKASTLPFMSCLRWVCSSILGSEGRATWGSKSWVPLPAFARFVAGSKTLITFSANFIEFTSFAIFFCNPRMFWGFTSSFLLGSPFSAALISVLGDSNKLLVAAP